MKQLIRIIGTLLFLVKLAQAGPWSEAQSASGAGDYGRAVLILTQAVESGEVYAGDVARFETQVFLWRRELGEGREAVERLLELPTRTTEGLESAALALGDYFSETPADLNLWSQAVERYPDWRQHADNLAERLLEHNALEAAARVAGAEPNRCRRVLNDLARHPELAELALASYSGDPYELDLGTWRVWLRLLESARGAGTAVEAALMRVGLDPGRVEFRREASERLRGLGRTGEALLLWEDQDGSMDDRVYVERGECLFALGRLAEAVENWRAKLDKDHLRPGDVRTVARIFTDHNLVEEALQLLTSPPTGTFRDYAKDIANLHFSLGRYRDAAETCAEVAALEGLSSWSVAFFEGFGEDEKAALTALEIVKNRDEPLFGRIRLLLAISPWALSSVRGDSGPLHHPWREREPAVELDVRARRAVQDEIRWLEDYFSQHPDAIKRLVGSGGLLPVEVVDLLGLTGLTELALESALNLASLTALTSEARGVIAASGLSYASATPLNAHGVEVGEILALNPEDRELRWQVALFLLRGDRPGEAETLLEELAEGYGDGPDEETLLAARIETALLLGNPDGAWDLTGKSPEGIHEPYDSELHYRLTLLQLLSLADELERDRSFDPAHVLDWTRRYIARNGDDPRATDLLHLVLAFGFAGEDEGRKAFVELIEAYGAGIRGDWSERERHLRRALAGGGPLGAEAAVQLADNLAEGGDYAEARDTLRDVIEAGIEGTSDRALALAAWLDADYLDETDRAATDLTELIGGYPGSVLLEYARRGLAALNE